VTDTILFNGRITTLEPSNPTATAVAIDKGLLVAVYRWLGALGLGGFTLIATFVANRFWEIPQPHRFMVENRVLRALGAGRRISTRRLVRPSAACFKTPWRKAWSRLHPPLIPSVRRKTIETGRLRLYSSFSRS